MIYRNERDCHNNLNSQPKILYNEFKPGQTLQFTLKTLQPDGSIGLSDEEVVINSQKGGGFFGTVLIPEKRNFVFKTSLPDPLHHFLRTINWDFQKFPPQYEETAAQLEHLAGRIIYAVLPIVTSGRFYSPQSLGYAWLSTGFAQVVEKIEGRPTRFDKKEENEYAQFKQSQKELSEIAFSLGLEQVGQIHPDNPFGLANLWFNEKNQRWIWLDIIPAIPHRIFVYPFFRFKFHKEVRQRLNEGKRSFNQIHVNQFRNYLMEYRKLFSDEQYQELLADLNLYERVRQQYNKEAKKEIGIDIAAQALAEVVKEKAVDTGKFPIKLVQKGTIDLVRTIFDMDFRLKPVIERMQSAQERGLITQEEFNQAMEVLTMYRAQQGIFSREGKVLTGLTALYVIESILMNIVQNGIAGLTVLSTRDLGLGAEIWLGFQAAQMLARPLMSLIYGWITRSDLRVAASVSWLPTVGLGFSFPAQLSFWAGGQSKEIWHQTVRSFVTNLSSVLPQGGLGSDLEAQLWNSIGTRLEALVQFKDRSI